MQSRNWTSVGSSQQKESRLLYFGRRGLRLRTRGRELIGHPDQLGQGPGTHFSHHLAAMDHHRCLAYTGNATACLDRGVGPGPLFSEKTQPQLQTHAAGPGRGNHRVLRQHAIVNCSWSGSIFRVCPKMVGQKTPSPPKTAGRDRPPHAARRAVGSVREVLQKPLRRMVMVCG
jgi:hypothetical protein